VRREWFVLHGPTVVMVVLCSGTNHKGDLLMIGVESGQSQEVAKKVSKLLKKNANDGKL